MQGKIKETDIKKWSEMSEEELKENFDKAMGEIRENSTIIDIQNKEIEKLKKQLHLAEEAIDYAYHRCENCYKGICQYCYNSFVVRYHERKNKL